MLLKSHLKMYVIAGEIDHQKSSCAVFLVYVYTVKQTGSSERPDVWEEKIIKVVGDENLIVVHEDVLFNFIESSGTKAMFVFRMAQIP